MTRLIFILVLFSSALSNAQDSTFWTYMRGPYGGKIHETILDQDNVLYISTYNGIFRSTNNGDSWEQVLEGRCWDIVLSPKNVIAVENTGISDYDQIEDINISYDQGDTWSNVSRIWSGRHVPSNIVFDKNDGLYLLTFDADTYILYYSSDYGISWSDSSYKITTEDGLKFRNIEFAYDSTIVLFGHYDGVERDMGIYYLTSDKGHTFKIEKPIPNTILHMEFLSEDEIVIGSRGLFLSNDKGLTWDNLLENVTVYDTELIGDEYYLGTKDGFYYSSNSGENWEMRNNGIPDSSLYEIIVGDSGYIYSTFYDFYSSTDKGKSWIQSNNGFSGVYTKCLSFYGQIVYLSSQSGFYRSTNSGYKWEYMGLQNYRLGPVICNNKGDVFLEIKDEDIGIFRSTDKGETWVNFHEGLVYPGRDINFYDIVIDNENNIFASALVDRVLKSTDNGESWNKCGPPSDCIAINSEGYLFSGGTAAEIVYSTNKGEDWIEVYRNNMDFFELEDIEFDPHSRNGFAVSRSYSYKTTNNGYYWRPHEEHLGGNSFAVDSAGNYYCTYARSTDKGKSWYAENSGLKNWYFNHVAVSPEGYIFLAAEHAGLYRSTRKYTSVDNETDYPNVVLNQNYPNPFADRTVIEYNISSQGYVRLSITDLFGNELLVAVDGFKDAGKHAVSISTESFSSGIYLYRIETGGRIETRQMSVVR